MSPALRVARLFFVQMHTICQKNRSTNQGRPRQKHLSPVFSLHASLVIMSIKPEENETEFINRFVCVCVCARILVPVLTDILHYCVAWGVNSHCNEKRVRPIDRYLGNCSFEENSNERNRAIEGIHSPPSSVHYLCLKSLHWIEGW